MASLHLTFIAFPDRPGQPISHTAGATDLDNSETDVVKLANQRLMRTVQFVQRIMMDCEETERGILLCPP